MQKRLKDLLEKLGISQNELARLAGLSSGQISNVMSGRVKSLSAEAVGRIADRFGVSANWLLTGEGEMFVGGAAMDPALVRMGAVPSTEHLLPKIKLRYYPNGVPASPFNLADDSYEIMELARTEGLHEECIVVRVRGRSLTDAGILNGDLLIVDTRLRTPVDGDLVIAAIGEESTVKFWSVEGKNGDQKFFLQPASFECAPIEVTGRTDLRINGTVTEVRRVRPHWALGGTPRLRDESEKRG